MNLPTVILKSGKEKSVLRQHPWVFSGAVYGVSRDILDGELVLVSDSKGNPLATGYFSDKGSIVVRILTFGDEVFDATFWSKRLKAAWELRMSLVDLETTNAFRLIHGEGDGIPGLIIDYYNKNWVLQAHSTGIFYNWKPLQQQFKLILKTIVQPFIPKAVTPYQL